MNATAFNATIAIPAAVTVPLTTSVLIARASRLRTSSMTAAPIWLLRHQWSFPISRSTFAVIAMLVAVRAVPIKIALAVSNPKSRESQYPPIHGIITPTPAITPFLTKGSL